MQLDPDCALAVTELEMLRKSLLDDDTLASLRTRDSTMCVDRVEHVLLLLGAVPHVALRLSAAAFARAAADQAHVLTDAATVVAAACGEMQKSVGLRTLLRITLDVRNRLLNYNYALLAPSALLSSFLELRGAGGRGAVEFLAHQVQLHDPRLLNVRSCIFDCTLSFFRPK